MASRKFTTTKSRAVRMTRLDPCGVPLIGTKSTLVTYGFVKVDNAFDVEDGEAFESRNAWGDYCVNEKDDPRTKGTEATMEWCQVDPDAYDMWSGARVLAAGAEDTFATVGESIGFAIGESTVPGAFRLEAWTKIGGGACSAEGDPVWAYTNWAWLYGGKVGNETLERGTATFPMTALGRGAPASALVDPYDEGLPALAAGDIFLRRLTLVQPPAETDGAVALAAITP